MKRSPPALRRMWRSGRVRWYAVAAWLVIVCYFTLMSQPVSVGLQRVSGAMEIVQNVAQHVVLFGILTLLYLEAALARRPFGTLRLMAALGVLVGMAAINELGQGLVQNRSSSWIDLGSNVGGVVLVTLGWALRRSARGHDDSHVSLGASSSSRGASSSSRMPASLPVE